MTSIKEIYWLAGLLEGEGYFSAANNRDTATTFKIGIGMTDLDVVEKASWLLNGVLRIHSNGREQNGKFLHYKRVYKTQCHGDRAISWMMTIYPLMGNRRKARIRSIIAEWKEYARRKDRCRKCGRDYSIVKIRSGWNRGKTQQRCFYCRDKHRDVAKSLGLDK